MKKFLSIISVLLALAGGPAEGRTPADTLLLKADSLRTAYRFGEAVDMLDAASEDSLLAARIEQLYLLCENGLRLSGAVCEPKVAARQRFSVRDFMLYYPLPDRSWRKTPNLLDSLGAAAPALYAPEGAGSILFSSPDTLGFYHVAQTVFADSLWTRPAPLLEEISPLSNDIYPMVSGDGRTLYFASDGLYGMGGYDLYKSVWDEEKESWGTPENLGFPFSSPFNDFLLTESPDGRYTIFASDRGCPSDSVDVYVLDYELNPVRKPVLDSDELARICALEPTSDMTRFDNGSTAESEIEENDDIDRYVAKVREVKRLKGAISSAESSLSDDRALFAEIDDDGRRADLSAKILEKEASLPALYDSLGKATSALQDIEMDFLFKGVVLDPDKLLAKVDRELVGMSSGYTFTKMNFGGGLKLSFAAGAVEEPAETESAEPEPAVPVPSPKKGDKAPTAFYEVVITALDTEIPEEVLSIVRNHSDRDMTRSRVDGRMVYNVGPFKEKAAAEELVTLVGESALATAEIREIPLD